MDADSAAERQREELRADVDRLHEFMQLALDTRADRKLVLAIAAMLREKTQRLEELESPGWIE